MILTLNVLEQTSWIPQNSGNWVFLFFVAINTQLLVPDYLKSIDSIVTLYRIRAIFIKKKKNNHNTKIPRTLHDMWIILHWYEWIRRKWWLHGNLEQQQRPEQENISYFSSASGKRWTWSLFYTKFIQKYRVE